MNISRALLSAACVALSSAAFAAGSTAAPVTETADARASVFFERAFDERVAASPEFAAQLGQRLRYDEWTPITEAERTASLAEPPAPDFQQEYKTFCGT